MQNEDDSPGDRTSDNSEKLLQRGRGEGQYVWDFGEGGVQAIRFCRKFLLVTAAVLTMKDFRALLGMIYKN